MRKNNKKALVLSCLSLLLCVSMLVGTTFAWFTDNESISVSKIEAGKLELGLYTVDKDGVETDISTSTTPIFDYDLWEPGHVRIANFKVANKGNLALKWQAKIVSTSEKIGALADVIDVYASTQVHAFDRATFEQYTQPDDVWGMTLIEKVGTLREVIEGEKNIVANDTRGGVIYPNIAPYNESTSPTHYVEFTVALKMQESAGNAYQGKSAGTFDIQIQATQATVESDSFDDQYDAGAEYDKLVNVRNQTELNKAVADATEPVNLVLSGDTYTLPSLEGKTVTISGSKNTVIDTTTVMPKTNNASLTFEGVTVKFRTADGYDTNGFTHTKALTYKDCVIEGQQFLYAPNNTFINCTFKNSGDNYNVWTYGTNTTFTDCTFECDGKAVLIYTEGQVTASYTFSNCTFNDKGGIDNKAAIEVGESAYGNKANYTINVNNCTVNGFNTTEMKNQVDGANYGTNVWGNKNGMPADRLNVFINGTEVY